MTKKDSEANLIDARRVTWARFCPLVVYKCCGSCKRTTPPHVCKQEGVVLMIKWRKTCVDASNDNGTIKTSDPGVNGWWGSNSESWG